MNYAGVVSGSFKPEKQQQPKPEPKKDEPAQNLESSPQPQQAPEEATIQPEQKQEQPKVEYLGNDGGAFQVLNQTCINAIVGWLPPVSHIAVGTTCHHLLKAFLNLNSWYNFQRQIPRSFKPVFSIEVKIPIKKKGESEESGFAVDDIEADGIPIEGDSASVSAGFFRKEARKQHLQKVWKYQASKIQKARDKQWDEDNKKEKDPLLTSSSAKKPPFEMKFPGGFVLSYREPQNKQNPNSDDENKTIFFASARDLADLGVWLEGAQKLLQGEKQFTVPLSNSGAMQVSRFGRGGSQLSLKLKSSPQKVVFQMADFILSLRSTAKEFTPIIGRILMLINQDVKNIQKEESDDYLEYEKFVTGAFKLAKISSAISKIKELLERGAVPHSNVQSIIKKKREKKKESRAQVEIENSNILDFIYANLPSDYSEARKQAVQQSEDARQLREEAVALAAVEREKRRQERAVQREIERQKKEKKRLGKDKEEDEEEKTAKTKTKVEKIKGEDGFITVDVKYTKLDSTGNVVKEFTATDKGKEEFQHSDKAEKKKNKKASQASLPNATAEIQVSPALQNNPFAAAPQAGGFESAAEVQAKLNSKKGELRNLQNNIIQKERKVTPPPPPQIVSKPKVKQNKKKNKKEKDTEDSQPEEISVGLSSAVNPRVVVACAALAVSVLSYFLLLS